MGLSLYSGVPYTSSQQPGFLPLHGSTSRPCVYPSSSRSLRQEGAAQRVSPHSAVILTRRAARERTCRTSSG